MSARFPIDPHFFVFKNCRGLTHSFEKIMDDQAHVIYFHFITFQVAAIETHSFSAGILIGGAVPFALEPFTIEIDHAVLAIDGRR
jgi:hypothetical protein